MLASQVIRHLRAGGPKKRSQTCERSSETGTRPAWTPRQDRTSGLADLSDQRQEERMHAQALDYGFRDGVIHVDPETDGIIAVCLEGEFDLANAPALADRVTSALDSGTGLIVDLTEATFIDSTVIEALVRVAKTAAEQDKIVVLQLGTETVVERAIEIVGIERIIACAHERQEAVQIIHEQIGVTRSNGSADPRYSHEPSAEEQHLHVALRERARNARHAAKETVAHSKDLAWLLSVCRQDTLTSRCAWCRRYRVGEHWLDAGRTPPVRASPTTHTICDDCAQALRDGGVSA